MALQITSGFVVATMIIAAWPAHAQDPFCIGIPFISTDNLTEGHISSKATRVHFVKDGHTTGCPDQTAASADKAYLVPGDRLIVAKQQDAFICAIYLNAKRNPHVGWLPADAVAYDMAKPIALTDWLGKWSCKWPYGEADLDIGLEAGKPGTLVIASGASYRGHEAQMEAEVTPTGDRLSFAIGDDGTTLPFEKGAELDCKVQMQRLGPWLIVNDGGKCGRLHADGAGSIFGDNHITFRGVYTRKP
jgi:hypothetical protein